MCEGTTQTALDSDVMYETKVDPDNKDLRRKKTAKLLKTMRL